MLPTRIVCLKNVCQDGTAFDDGFAVGCHEDGRLSKLLNVGEFWGCAVVFGSLVKNEIVFDGELFEEPNYALGLRVLQELASANVEREIHEH
jgi:hypothetical protein